MFTDDIYKKYQLDEIISIPELAEKYFKDLEEAFPPEERPVFLPNSPELKNFIVSLYKVSDEKKGSVLNYLKELEKTEGRQFVDKLLRSLLDTASLYFLALDAIRRKREAHKVSLREGVKNGAKTKIEEGKYLAERFTKDEEFNESDPEKYMICKFCSWCAPRRKGKYHGVPPSLNTAKRWLKEAGVI